MNKKLISEFDNYLAENKENILECIMKLAKYPSIEGKPESGAPFGIECRKCLDAALELMKENGFETELCSDGKYGIASLGNGEKHIGIFAHTDVVPVNEQDWIYTKPFQPKRIGDVLVGRGVCDNKSGVALALYAAKMLYDTGNAPESTIEVFLGSNEETGMADIEAFAKERKMPDVSLVPDNAFPVSFGEKGLLHTSVIFDKAFEDVTEFSGGTAYNIMLDTVSAKIKYSDALLCELLAVAKINKRIKVEKTDDGIDVSATGLACHAAHPDDGINAAGVMAQALMSCPSLSGNDREILSEIKKLTDDIYGEYIGISCCDEYFGKLTSTNGICKTVNGKPVLTLDIRYGTGITSAKIMERIRALYPASTLDEDKPGFAIPRDDKIALRLEKIYAEVSGDKAAKGYYSGGGTYARYLKNAFSIGEQAYYIENKIPELPEGHGSVHQSDEILRINGHIEAIKIVALMILGCDEELYGKN